LNFSLWGWLLPGGGIQFPPKLLLLIHFLATECATSLYQLENGAIRIRTTVCTSSGMLFLHCMSGCLMPDDV
jgi:hypothetical protein